MLLFFVFMFAVFKFIDIFLRVSNPENVDYFSGLRLKCSYGWKNHSGHHLIKIWHRASIRSLGCSNLKIGKSTHEKLSQMQLYVNYYYRGINLKKMIGMTLSGLWIKIKKSRTDRTKTIIFFRISPRSPLQITRSGSPPQTPCSVCCNTRLVPQ
jgi:hypothetical protein